MMTEIENGQAKLAPKDMAGAQTPFIHNTWYVAGESSEFGREPMARVILGVSIVFFRTQAGKLVALQNRCCHRSFPLVHGRLEGDTLVCGYHGLRFNVEGRCVEMPTQRTIPSTVGIRAFPTEERSPFVWIWMGEAASAALQLLPHQEWMDHPDWETRGGYLHIKGSYVHLHENLLDLSHLSFLHAKTFGTPEYAGTRPETTVTADEISVWRHVDCFLPPIYAKPLGWTGVRARRSSGSQFIAPGLHVNTGVFKRLDAIADDSDPHPTIKVAQLITPETSYTTHYWSLQARNFALGDSAMGDFMLEQQMVAFREDVFAIENATMLRRLEGEESIVEVHLPIDRAGVLMRRRLLKLVENERRARVG
jgi:vanillate O-demethylase monooxygenase subunit